MSQKTDRRKAILLINLIKKTKRRINIQYLYCKIYRFKFAPKKRSQILHGMHVDKSDVNGSLPLDPYSNTFDLYYVFGTKSYKSNQREQIDIWLGSLMRSRYNKIYYTFMYK